MGKDKDYSISVEAARKRLVPTQIGKDGTLQEWTEDYGQAEDDHRHFSHLYGLYPGNVLSARRTPEYVEPIKKVLYQRGDGGMGFSRTWKMSLWARLYDGEKALSIYKGYIKDQCHKSLFAMGGSAQDVFLVEGALGATAAITSKAGGTFSLLAKGKIKVLSDGKEVKIKMNHDGSIQFETIKGRTYQLKQS